MKKRAQYTGRTRSPLYGSWSHMLDRCLNPRHKNWKHYGGRGITVCERWLTFENFVADMGPKPLTKRSIERVDNNGNYEPSNCVWGSTYDQARNKRTNVVLEFQGESAVMSDHAARLGIRRATLLQRLRRWPKEQALSQPKRDFRETGKRITYQGLSLTLRQWSERTGLPLCTLRNRFKKPQQWPVERALTEPRHVKHLGRWPAKLGGVEVG